MENIKQVYGKNIRTLRKQKGYTLQFLAKRVGITHQQLSRIENGGGTSSNTLERIAMALNVSPSMLVEEQGQQEYSKEPFVYDYKNFVQNKVYEELYNDVSDLFLNKVIRRINDDIISNFITDIAEALYDRDWVCQTVNSLTDKSKDYYKFTHTELNDFCRQFTFICIDQIAALARDTGD